MKSTVTLIEPDVAQRAELTQILTKFWHVEPFEDVAELQSFWPRNTAFIFAHDESDTLGRLMDIPAAQCLPIMAYSRTPQTEQVVRAIRLGVIDYFALPLDPGTALPRLKDTIESVKFEVEARRQQAAARELVADLSRRETEVGRELVAGHSNKGIAKVLGISPRTVEIHRANMMSKLRVTSTAEAVKVLLDARMIN